MIARGATPQSIPVYFKSTRSFEEYLKKSQEVGFVQHVFPSIVYANGLPSVTTNEVVVFESGELGIVYSISSDYVEILLLTSLYVKAGTRITRTNSVFQIPVGDNLKGKSVDALGRPILKPGDYSYVNQMRSIDVEPLAFQERIPVIEPLHTGVAIVDTVIPLGKGQRELVIGDSKTGKTSFLIQSVLSQAKEGTICIYATIGKRRKDYLFLETIFKDMGVRDSVVIVNSYSFDPPGNIYLTPYTAMAIAEYYRDKGVNTIVVFDDLTTHAKYYRQISLLAKRFPGRSSYPGDIFYIHSRLLERAGRFKTASISALPVADTVQSDLSSYIQTNLMAITDGHIFFDSDLFNQGRRPAINPYLSVTRVGEQAQLPLVRELSRKLSQFLVHYERITQLSHFGGEFEERLKNDVAIGELIFKFYNQSHYDIVPLSVDVIILALILNNGFKDVPVHVFEQKTKTMIQRYTNEESYKAKLDKLVIDNQSYISLSDTLTREQIW